MLSILTVTIIVIVIGTVVDYRGSLKGIYEDTIRLWGLRALDWLM